MRRDAHAEWMNPMPDWLERIRDEDVEVEITHLPRHSQKVADYYRG